MKNRNGIEYNFIKVNENTFQFEMKESEMQYCRYGGLEGQERLDYNNLGFFDPSGGPFIGVGGKIFGKTISRIFLENEKIYMETL
jgi:hypothetical protein